MVALLQRWIIPRPDGVFIAHSWHAIIRRALLRGWAVALLATSLLFSGWVSAQTTANAGDLVIAEFRVRGPSGANDEYVVIQNVTALPHTVTSASGTGYGLAASDGVTRFSIPNGTVIPAGGFYLGAGSAYSLSSAATSNASWTVDIPDNAGIALFNTDVIGNYTLANRLDAVGSTSEANTLYKEGTGYFALTPFSIDYAFYRDVCGHGGLIAELDPCPAAGVVKDTNNNAADFVFVDTNGTPAGAGQRLGTPSPRNLASPVAKLGAQGVSTALLDTSKTLRVQPNWQRDQTSDPANNAVFGTIAFNRVFTNHTGAAITQLRWRIVDLTTFPAPSGFADLRPHNSPTDLQSGFLVNGATLIQPPSQPNGGGFNSSYIATSVNMLTPLQDGESIALRFQAGVQQTGEFKIRLMLEALTDSGVVAGSELLQLTGHTETGPYLVPAISAIAPATGAPAGGNVVTLTGAGFMTGATVDFGGTAGTNVVIDSDTQMRVTAPAHALGLVQITVTTAGGVSNSVPYNYQTPAPTITSLEQNSGPLLGGNTITIYGTGFSSVLPSGSIRFGSAYPDYQVASDTQLSVLVPAGSTPGAVNVTVTTAHGSSTPLTYTYLAAPSISSLSPVAGPRAGATSVTITGVGLTGVSAVRFGSANAVFSPINDTSVIATSPAGAAGAVPVTVTTPGGNSTANPAAVFTYADVPTVIGLAMRRGPITGGAVEVITGSNFNGATSVKFGAVEALGFTVNSDTQITAITPPGSVGVVDVTVTTPEGTSATSSASQFRYQLQSATVTTTSGDVAVLLSGAQCGFKELPSHTSAPASGVPAGFDFPYGQIAFTADGCDAGGSLTVNLTLPESIEPGAKLYKFVGGEWREWLATINGTSVQFALQDDAGSSGAASTGDNDPTPGTIDDPVLIAVPKAVPPTVTPVPVLNPWVLMALSLMLAAFGLRRVRRS